MGDFKMGDVKRCATLHFMENVEEIQTWGALMEKDGKLYPDPKHAGETFQGFISMLTTGIEKENPAFLEACEFLKLNPDSVTAGKLLKGLGYNVKYKTLKACDYGAPTIRKRFYLIARNDGKPIVFPEPTHGKGKGLKPYRTAAECIDWNNIPCPSIFERERPLVENTLRRIARGLDKFVIKNPKPYILQMNFDNAPQDIEKPMSTQTTVNHHYLALPSLVQYHSEQGKSEVRGQKVKEPLQTVDTQPRYAVNGCYLTKYFSGEKQAGASLKEPAPTVTAIDHNGLVSAHFVKYFSGENQYQAADEPAHTITTKDRLGLVTEYLSKADGVQNLYHWGEVRELLNKFAGYDIKDDEILIIEIDSVSYFICDVGLRMLKAKELKLAQGFPSDYIIDIETYIGKKYSEAKQIARLGNAVCPPVATALIKANCADMAYKKPLATVAELEKAMCG